MSWLQTISVLMFALIMKHFITLFQRLTPHFCAFPINLLWFFLLYSRHHNFLPNFILGLFFCLVSHSIHEYLCSSFIFFKIFIISWQFSLSLIISSFVFLAWRGLGSDKSNPWLYSSAWSAIHKGLGDSAEQVVSVDSNFARQ